MGGGGGGGGGGGSGIGAGAAEARRRLNHTVTALVGAPSHGDGSVAYTVNRRFRQFARLFADLKLTNRALCAALPPLPEGGLRAFKDRFSPSRVAERAKVFDAMLRVVSDQFPDVLDSFLMRRFLKQNVVV